MPQLSRKRRAPATIEDEASANSTPQPPSRSQRRQSTSSVSGEGDGEEGSDTSKQQLVKNLVRYALACEHARTPIRRNEISKTVLGSQGRQFKNVFDDAQLALRATFGMEMVELPAKEKVTIKDKRAAKQSQTQSGSSSNTSSKQWMLCSVLPKEFRDDEVLRPAKVPTPNMESAYVGLYSFIVAVISIAGGQMPRPKLDRILRRMNADNTTPIDRTDEVLKRMEKQGYIVKIKEQQGGEETEDFIVGPRGRVEIGNEGVAGLVRQVYGHNDEGGEANDELERRLARSLKVANLEKEPNQNGVTVSGAQTGGAGRRGRPRRNQQQQDDDESD